MDGEFKTVDRLRKLYHRLPPPSTLYYLHQMAYDPYTMLPSSATILDIGSKNTRGNYAFARGRCCSQLVNLDISLGPGVDLCADAHWIPLRSQSIDCVLSISTFEHVRHPQQIITEIYRVLKPGGLLYLNAPFVFPYHSDPDDFYRFSMNGLRILCEPFEEIQVGYNRGPASSMCHLLVHFAAILLCFNNTRAYHILTDVFRWCFFWIKYLDRWVGNYDVAKVIYSGVFFFGKKPISPDTADSYE